MPSSADEATLNEDLESQRKDSLKSANSKKKQNKKAKKAAAAAAVKILSEQQDESSGIDVSTPPIDLLAPPASADERALSSSPDAGLSDPEPPCPDTPPIFAQDIVGATPVKAHPAPQTTLEAAKDDVAGKPVIVEPLPDSSRNHAQRLPQAYGEVHDTKPLKSPPIPITIMHAQQRSPPSSPRPLSVSPRPAMVRPDPRPGGWRGSRNNSLTDAPPPHMPQRHFSRAPDMNFGLLSNGDNEIVPGTQGYYCGFDTRDGSSNDSRDSSGNVLLVGSEGALDVCRYNRNRREVIGRLEGLRGSVIDAKILPCLGPLDPFAHSRPLIICVLHGPAMDEESSDQQVSGAQIRDINKPQDVQSYQTTVEVFSLRSSKLVGVLLKTSPLPLQYPLGHPHFIEPKPQGSLTIHAEGHHIVIASGESGEVFVFAPSDQSPSDLEPAFRCLGKFWTRTREQLSVAQNDGLQLDPRLDEDVSRHMPIMALSRRWLAISPPALSSLQKSIDGRASVSPRFASPPGVNAYVSSPPPAIDCEIDGAFGPSLLNRVTKQATNEIRKGAQWVGEQGMGMIKSYWNRGPAPNGQNSSPAMRKPSPEDQNPHFPPTHAQNKDQPAANIEASLVSIIDLQKLSDFENSRVKNPLAPLATLSLADGCSFLSFSPVGLTLLTTNQVGDSSTIWDLMHITDSHAAANMSSANSQISHASGMVRKVVSLTRLSPSIVVDVQWTPASNRVGILTSKGTLHLHEMPRQDSLSSTFRSPTSPASIPRSDLPSPSSSPQDLSSGWINNVRSGWQNVSGRLTAIRSVSDSNGGIVSSTRQSLNQASVAARYASGRAVRNGYNSALEGAYSLRHSQDNKIRLKSLQHVIRPGCFRWMSGKDEGLISTVADGVLCTYTVKSNYHVQGKRTIVVLDASRKAGPVQTLPLIAATKLPPALLGWLQPDGPHASCARAGVHGFWTLNRESSSISPGPRIDLTSSTVQQDKETCPQYLPLHQLKQVNLFTYDERNLNAAQKALGVSIDSDPWCFGQPLGIHQSKVNVAPSRAAIVHDTTESAFEDVVGPMEDFSLDEGLLNSVGSGQGGGDLL